LHKTITIFALNPFREFCCDLIRSLVPRIRVTVGSYINRIWKIFALSSGIDVSCNLPGTIFTTIKAYDFGLEFSICIPLTGVEVLILEAISPMFPHGF